MPDHMVHRLPAASHLIYCTCMPNNLNHDRLSRRAAWLVAPYSRCVGSGPQGIWAARAHALPGTCTSLTSRGLTCHRNVGPSDHVHRLLPSGGPRPICRQAPRRPRRLWRFGRWRPTVAFDVVRFFVVALFFRWLVVKVVFEDGNEDEDHPGSILSTSKTGGAGKRYSNNNKNTNKSEDVDNSRSIGSLNPTPVQ